MLGSYFKFNLVRKLTKRKNTSNKIKLWETDETGQWKYRFCWYLIFIVNHKSFGFLAKNQVYIRFKASVWLFYGNRGTDWSEYSARSDRKPYNGGNLIKCPMFKWKRQVRKYRDSLCRKYSCCHHHNQRIKSTFLGTLNVSKLKKQRPLNLQVSLQTSLTELKLM